MTAAPHPVSDALRDAAPVPFWTDRDDAPEPCAPLTGRATCDLLVVGGGFTGLWAAIEAKLGSSRIPEAERALLTLRDSRVDLQRRGHPAFLAVVTGTEYAYTLLSGVHVVPLSALAT